MENEKNTQLFSRRLVGARQKKTGLTQTELAKKVGVSLRSVQNWEGGKSMPRGKDLRTLCATLECSIGYLLGAENESKQVAMAIRDAVAVENGTGIIETGTAEGLIHVALSEVEDLRGRLDRVERILRELAKRVFKNG